MIVEVFSMMCTHSRSFFADVRHFMVPYLLVRTHARTKPYSRVDLMMAGDYCCASCSAGPTGAKGGLEFGGVVLLMRYHYEERTFIHLIQIDLDLQITWISDPVCWHPFFSFAR